jgi:glycosyltransferase involved in cell wall biosynthesis
MAAGESTQETMIARSYGHKPHAIVPLGVDLDDFYPHSQARQRVMQGLGWETESSIPVIGFLGRLVPEKGLGLLTRALDDVSTPWRALFVGNGPMESHLLKWSRRHPDRVRVLTNVKHAEVPSHLNAMDLLCAPSQTTPRWREQFGRVVIEAFACGVPVIGSDSGEIPYVVDDAGVIVPETDDDGWTQAIEELLGNPTRRRELSARGLERVHRLYTWKVAAQKHLEFFDQITDSKH